MLHPCAAMQAACEFQFSATQQSVLSSVVFGGMVLGAASWGLAADALGRRTTLLASCGVVVAGGLASAAAPSYPVREMNGHPPAACCHITGPAARGATTIMLSLVQTWRCTVPTLMLG